MANFKYDFFQGIRPRLSPRLIGHPQAQTMQNVRLGSGALEPWNEPLLDQLTTSGNDDVETIYRFRNGGTPVWFEFQDDVDLARGPLLDDPLERTFYTGTAQATPRMTYVGIATGGGQEPDDFRVLGHAAPTVAPTLVGDSVAAEALTGTCTSTASTPAGDTTGGGLTGILTNVLKCDFAMEQPGREPYLMNSWVFGDDFGFYNASGTPIEHTFAFDVNIGTELQVLTVPQTDEVTVNDANGGLFIWQGSDRVADNSSGGHNKFSDSSSGLFDGYFRFYIPNGIRLTMTAVHNLLVDDVIRVSSVTDSIRFTIGNGLWGNGGLPQAAHPGDGEFYGGQSDSVGIDPAVGTWPTNVQVQGQDDFYTNNGFKGHAFVDAWWHILGSAAVTWWPMEGSFGWTITERGGVPYNEIVTDVESRVYVYTWVSDLGEEGPPSDPSAIVTIPTDGDVTVTMTNNAPSTNKTISNVRIYRANTGSSESEFQFVAEVAYPTAPYLDQISDINLGEVLQTTSWDPPDANMEGMIALPNGVLAGFTGKDVQFSEPYFPHAWPVEYEVAVDFDIIGLGVLPQGLLVLTTGTPYMVVGNHPRAMSLRHFEFAQSCSSKKSIVNTKDSVIYASPDGLVRIGAGGFEVITENFFTKRDWNNLLDPTTIDGNWHDGRYFGFHNTGSIIFDPFDDSIGLSTAEETSSASYVDAENDDLYIIPKPTLSDHYVAVADGTGTNCIMSSIDDGVNWVQATVIDKNFTGIAWSPVECIWVAVARDNATGNVFTSSDGLVWTQGSIDGISFLVETLLWSTVHNIFVLAGTSTAGGNHDFAWSADGLTWTRFPSSTATRVQTLSFNEDADNPLYIAYDDNSLQNLWTSVNGKTWTSTMVQQLSTTNIVDAAYSSSLGYWALMSSAGGGEIFTTTDGETLVSQGSPFNGIQLGIGWSDTLNLFVAVGQGPTNFIMSSPTALSGTWTLRTNPGNGTLRLNSVKYDTVNSQFIAVGDTVLVDEEAIFSADGISWTAATDADFGKDWVEVGVGQAVTGSAAISKWDGDTATQQTMTWKSGQLRADYPYNLGVARIIADSYPLTFRLYNEGTLEATITVNDDEMFRLPGGFLGDYVELEITHDDAIRSVMVAETAAELGDG